MTALLAVAHGSPDPRAQPVLAALVERTRAARPGLTATLAYLGHAAPDVPSALDSLVERGAAEVVVVPLLLTAAYHARADLPRLLATARQRHPQLRLTQAGVLGPHPLLHALVKRRLVEAGARPSASVVLGAIGTSSTAANAELAGVARGLGAAIGFAAGAPWVADVVRDVRARGAGDVALISYVLAPGTLPDRFTAAGADIVTAPLGAEPEVVAVVLERYDAAAAALARSSLDGDGTVRPGYA